MPTAVFSRVQQRLTELGRSARAVSLAAGMSADAIRDLGRPKRGKWTSPTVETIEKLSVALDVSPEWLAFGVDDRHGAHERIHGDGLRVLGEIAAGVWLEADADRHQVSLKSIAPDPRFPAHAQFLLRARGTSMNAVIDPGDLIHCVDCAKARITPEPNDIVVVERHCPSGEREVTAKRLIIRDGTVLLAADSTDPQWAGYHVSPEVDDGAVVVATALVIRAIKEFR